MGKNYPSGAQEGPSFSPVRTRRSSSRKNVQIKECLRSDSSENEATKPARKRLRRQHDELETTKDDNNMPSSTLNSTKSSTLNGPRTRTRSLTLQVEFTRKPDSLLKKNHQTSNSVPSKGKGGSKKHETHSQPQKTSSSRAVRRSERESRKVFHNLNETSLVQSMVGDFYHQNRHGEGNRSQNADDGPDYESSSYVNSMYDRIKSKSKDDKDDEDEDEDDNSSEEDDDDDDTPQQRYELRENKPVTKRYMAPPPKAYHHSSRRGLFSGSSHLGRRECSSKQPFSPVRKSYKWKRKTINESSTSTDDDDDDNRKFERRKAKSMAKARNRCLPMNLGAEDVSKGVLCDRERVGSSLADVDPMKVDRSITFESIGGLNKHVRSLKEMVVFPLLYPEIFQKFKVNPPRGVLFSGPPGTGKTLMARALANECSQENKKVAFFMRKGADCLSKWVGESERQLRLLFDQAFKMRPSIIFFDEIDGLAPVRSSRQDQIHSSIVSTLLALMDGLDSRGEVIVIGATNRIDSIDPALRRPGRFDRELIFPLPDNNARRSILTIHTKNWQPRLTQQFINEVADHCVGYCGADIHSLCTEATLSALRRTYPQIYASQKKLVLDTDKVCIRIRDFRKAMQTIVPASQRAMTSPARPLSSILRPLLEDILRNCMDLVKAVFPPAVTKTVGDCSPGSSVQPLAVVSDSESSDDGEDDEDLDIYEADPTSSEGARVLRAARAARRAELRGLTDDSTGGQSWHCFNDLTITAKSVYRPRFLICGPGGTSPSTHLAPALLHSMEHLPVHTLDLAALFGSSSRFPEEACVQIFREARRVSPCIIYVPRISSLWHTLTETFKATFLSMVADLPPTEAVLLLATSDLPVSELPSDVTTLFSQEANQVFEVPVSSENEHKIYLEAARRPPSSKKRKTKKPLEVLPVASQPAARLLNPTELQKLRQEEENTLRELRIFLREITVKLMSDRRFKIFEKPVDLEEVPDYTDVIQSPMDLSTMLQKVDGHLYQTCREYLLDVDLITSNALEYNPNGDNFDRAIRHQACALQDGAHSLIKSQLDVDFEKACQDIVASRSSRGEARNVCAPKFFPVAPVTRTRPQAPADDLAEPAVDAEVGSGDTPAPASEPTTVHEMDVDMPSAQVPESSAEVSVIPQRKSRHRGRFGKRRRRPKPSAAAVETLSEPEFSGPADEGEDSETVEEQNDITEDNSEAQDGVTEEDNEVDDGHVGINDDKVEVTKESRGISSDNCEVNKEQIETLPDETVQVNGEVE